MSINTFWALAVYGLIHLVCNKLNQEVELALTVKVSLATLLYHMTHTIIYIYFFLANTIINRNTLLCPFFIFKDKILHKIYKGDLLQCLCQSIEMVLNWMRLADSRPTIEQIHTINITFNITSLKSTPLILENFGWKLTEQLAVYYVIVIKNLIHHFTVIML